MTKILICAAAVYLIIGLGISLRCFKKNGFGGTLFTMVLWPVVLVGSLFAGRCGDKKETVLVQGAQGSQGPQGNQGPMA